MGPFLQVANSLVNRSSYLPGRELAFQWAGRPAAASSSFFLLFLDSARPQADSGVNATYSLVVCFSSRGRAPAPTRAQKADAGDGTEAADWSGKRVARAALSVYE